jgi:hypothetical protein
LLAVRNPRTAAATACHAAAGTDGNVLVMRAAM